MEKIIIFSDGSSRGNPGPGGWSAILIFPEKNQNELGDKSQELKVKEIGGREENTTNNRMELTGAIQAFSFLKTQNSLLTAPVVLYSDSSYVVKGITSWIKGWKANDWMTKDKKEVSNKDLWQMLDEVSQGFKVHWNVISGHVGIAGNERCDEIATDYATGETPDLFMGSLQDYKISILDLKSDQEKVEIKKNKTKNSGKAYSYISKVDGEIKIHQTWKECEDRVKGKSNVRFKKSLSKIDEEKIVEEFTKGK
ncbi:MAG: ribonuclease HI [Candidatus Paceibacterota bacterium]